ncbi:hypothetical protein JTB14_033177 [Gonioctena quinquepunctata]|nr:hypothetical protein JTB14_033177 [Gonioctena quinquepunctata]
MEMDDTEAMKGIKLEFPTLNEKMHIMIRQHDIDLFKELMNESIEPTTDEGRFLNKHPNKYTMKEKNFHKNFDIMKSSPDDDFEELIGEDYENWHNICLKNLAFIGKNKKQSENNTETISNRL